MSEKIKRFLRKFAIYVLGLFLIGVAVNLIAESELGGDSVTVLYMGVSKSLSVAYGTSAYIYQFTLIIIAVLFARSHIGLGTFLFSFIVGLFVYLFEYVFRVLDFYPSLLIEKILFFSIGQYLLSLGLALVLAMRIGINGLDCILMSIRDRFGFSYRRLKIVADILIALIGFFLGGLVGIGTIVSVLTLGWLIQMNLHKIEKLDYIRKLQHNEFHKK